MAANPECIPSLIEGLGNYMKLVLTLTDQADTPVIEAAITQLFGQCIQTIYEQLNDKRECEDKVEHFYDLSRLMIIAFEILKGKQSLHFTALKSINQIIDLCVIHRNHEISCLTKSPEQLSNMELYKHSTPKRKSSQLTSEENTALNRHFSLGRKERRMSHDGHAHSHFKEQHEKSVEEKEDSKSSSLSNCMQVHRTPLDILSCCDPSQILSILHNNITMHKRIVGTRQKCTPSTRIRECTHHCLQIMSARILVVMCHGPSVQHKLVTDGHAKTLVEALDPNHDPHLLCLLLQCLSSVALNPTYHQSLIDADIADMLMQLLLPSDEWYYTNHSTKYAKYVKYHAARILVYLGQLHRLCGRVDLFDTKVFQEEVQQNPIFQGSSAEDTFIEQMALGRIVIWNNKQHIEASSLEGLITHVIEEAVLEEIDKTASPIISLSSSIQSLCILKSQSDLTTPPVSPACSVQTLIHFSQSSFREFLLMTLPMIVHPVIILRLLAHKMFGNMIRRKNWVAQESKLKPPKEDDLVVEKMCPPRSYSEGKKGLAESKRKKEMLGMEFDVCNTPGTFGTAALGNNQNGTNLALKAIGESLVTPLELNISTCKMKEHKPLSLTQSESPKGSKPRLFKWQSKKHLSKSQMNVSVSEDNSILDKLNLEHSPKHDVDILAFQRELINLPTFVMDTPIDISPVFSRSSSVPDNLASRLNPVSSLCQLSGHGSRRRLSKGGHGSEVALSALVPAGSITITKTDVDHHDSSLFFFPPGESTTDTPDESLANIIVHFDPPQSPLLSSASQSPQTFEFPVQIAPLGNHLQPSTAQGNASTGSSLLPRSTSNELSQSAPPFAKDIDGPELRTAFIKADARSPIHSPINDMPAAHKSVIKVLETWIRISRSDLENTAIVVHEMRDFLKKLSALGPEYKLWSQKFTGVLHLEVKSEPPHDKTSKTMCAQRRLRPDQCLRCELFG